ncbi:hypothetical protein [Pseudaestuariivita rosea]|uniref:hypothetical protein n=1 Tax=Pseudaestuariivita rosea TaxID=2763263 RepID=UPI001ABB03E4|nr:hypothetical protein [Pseudaestuariivita rosea]
MSLPELKLDEIDRQSFLRLIDEKRFMDAGRVLRHNGYSYKQTKILVEIVMQKVHPDYAAKRQRWLDRLVDEFDAESQ